MVRLALLLSFWLSLLSLVIVLFSPIQVPIRGEERVHSPYRDELDKLHGKNALTPVEYHRFLELIEKNNQWFENHKNEFLSKSATSAIDAWKRKSAFLSPLIMLVWGVMFYFFYRKHPDRRALLVLTFPVLLLVVQLMPLLEVSLIALVVFLVWFWFVMNPPKPSQDA